MLVGRVGVSPDTHSIRLGDGICGEIGSQFPSLDAEPFRPPHSTRTVASNIVNV